MGHSQAVLKLPDYVAGELDAAARDAVERHAAGCPECRSWLDAYRTLATALGGDGGGAEEHASSEEVALLAVDPAGLEEARRDALEAHLSSCGGCRGELELALAALGRAAGTAAAPAARPRPEASWRLAVGLAAGLVLLVAVGSLFERAAAPQPPPAEFELAAESISGSRSFEAQRSIRASRVSIEDGSRVDLRAGEAVELGDGFSVGKGATLTVEIGGSSSQRPAL